MSQAELSIGAILEDIDFLFFSSGPSELIEINTSPQTKTIEVYCYISIQEDSINYFQMDILHLANYHDSSQPTMIVEYVPEVVEETKA